MASQQRPLKGRRYGNRKIKSNGKIKSKSCPPKKRGGRYEGNTYDKADSSNQTNGTGRYRRQNQKLTG
jgi:hypothetical protein